MKALGAMKRFGYLLCLALGAPLQAEEASGWLPGAGAVPVVNLTVEEARQRAWELALKEASEKASLEVVGAALLRLQADERGEQGEHFAQFVRAVSRARVVAVDTLFDGVEMRRVEGGGRSELIYRVAIRARVQPETGTPDPAFQLTLRLEREILRDGEGLVMELEATQDCYATVLALYASDSLVVVFPNERMPDNRLQAGQPLRLPPARAGWDLPVRLLPGRESDQEMLLAVATKQPVPFPRTGRSREGLGALGEALLAINRWLIDVPADQRTEAMAVYRLIR